MTRKEKTALNGQATAEQIEKWRKQYSEVFEFGCKDKVCYLKKPGRKELSFASMTAGRDEYKWNEAIVEACWLGGDDEIKTNDDYFLPLCGQLAVLVEREDSYIKKV